MLHHSAKRHPEITGTLLTGTSFHPNSFVVTKAWQFHGILEGKDSSSFANVCVYFVVDGVCCNAFQRGRLNNVFEVWVRTSKKMKLGLQCSNTSIFHFTHLPFPSSTSPAASSTQDFSCCIIWHWGGGEQRKVPRRGERPFAACVWLCPETPQWFLAIPRLSTSSATHSIVPR